MWDLDEQGSEADIDVKYGVRALWKAGYQTVLSVASSDPLEMLSRLAHGHFTKGYIARNALKT